MTDHHALDISATLEDFYQDCLANGFTFRTVQSYRSSLRPWQDFLSQKGICSLDDVNANLLLEYRHYLHTFYRSAKGRPIAISTQAQKLTALRTYLMFCARIGKTLLNPIQALPKPKLPKSLPRGILSKQQIKKLLKLPDTSTPIGFRDRVILELFYCTGVRRNELLIIWLWAPSKLSTIRWPPISMIVSTSG